MKCHICGNETDFECRECGEPVCDDCTMPYNQFTQIDYMLCRECGGIREEMKAEKYYSQELECFHINGKNCTIKEVK